MSGLIWSSQWLLKKHYNYHPFYRWGNWGEKRLTNLLSWTELDLGPHSGISDPALLVCLWPACNRADIHTKPYDARTSALSLVAAKGVLGWPAGFPKVLSLILIIAPYLSSPAGSSGTNSGFRQVAWNTFPQWLQSRHQWCLVVQKTSHWVLLVPKTVGLCSVPPHCLVSLVPRESTCVFSVFSYSPLVQIPSRLGILWFTFHIFTEIPNYFLPTYFLCPCLKLITSLGNLLSRLSPLICQK